jgi:hypothetical protein
MECDDIAEILFMPITWAGPWKPLKTRPAAHISTTNQQELWI